eukprot:COSAG04_NODE_1486_length_6558_cov_44.896424_5_plen_60_part_00
MNSMLLLLLLTAEQLPVALHRLLVQAHRQPNPQKRQAGQAAVLGAQFRGSSSGFMKPTR